MLAGEFRNTAPHAAHETGVQYNLAGAQPACGGKGVQQFLPGGFADTIGQICGVDKGWQMADQSQAVTVQRRLNGVRLFQQLTIVRFRGVHGQLEIVKPQRTDGMDFIQDRSNRKIHRAVEHPNTVLSPAPLPLPSGADAVHRNREG